MKQPPFRDFNFYQCRKHDKWRAVAPPTPQLELPIADTHAHLHMLPDPLWELARAAYHGLDFVCAIADLSEDDLSRVFEILDHSEETLEVPSYGSLKLPCLKLALGVHPHNASRYTDNLEAELLEALTQPQVAALGEVGLDYFYDFSPRETQREVFRRQIRLAKKLNLPLALHIRSGKNEECDNAHADALAILEDEGWPDTGVLLHCCSLGPEEIQPWIDADCYIAYGGALTFKNNQAAREAASLVPINRLLLETDAPYMAPEPMRGAICTPAHVIFTVELLAQLRFAETGASRYDFLQTIEANMRRFFGLASQYACNECLEERRVYEGEPLTQTHDSAAGIQSIVSNTNDAQFVAKEGNIL